MDEKTRKRQNASRAARVARGERQVSVWLAPDVVANLDRAIETGETATQVINSAILVRQTAIEAKAQYDAELRETEFDYESARRKGPQE